MLATLVAAAFGLVAGSFLGLCAWRLPRGESVAGPPSRCTACRRRLRASENVPLFSFALQRGCCRGCGAAIGWRYPALEIACAAAFAACWLGWGAAGDERGFIRAAFFAACLLALAVCDAECRQLPDEITLGGWAVGLALASWAGALTPALAASFGGAGVLAAVGLGYQRARRREGLGWGDVKMVGLLGAFLGFEGMFVAVLLGSLAAAVVGVAQMLGVTMARRRRGQSWRRARAAAATYLTTASLPLGVYLAAGAGIALARGASMWRAWIG
ncbi:MAG TPA: prepilin peptidase [Terriglobales bacterium]|jgi:leader peptidase (prepilin peptidase)/N-methyltransferase